MTGNTKTGGARDGWRKGVGPYSKSYPEVSRATDYTKRGIAAASFGEPMTKGDRTLMGAGSKLWAPAKLDKKGDSSPRYAPKRDAGTSPGIKASSLRSKYARKAGGYGQRTGD